MSTHLNSIYILDPKTDLDTSKFRRSVIVVDLSINIWATTCDFQQFGILTSVDSDEPVKTSLSLETANDVQLVA